METWGWLNHKRNNNILLELYGFVADVDFFLILRSLLSILEWIVYKLHVQIGNLILLKKTWAGTQSKYFLSKVYLIPVIAWDRTD